MQFDAIHNLVYCGINLLCGEFIANTNDKPSVFVGWTAALVAFTAIRNDLMDDPEVGY